MGLLVLMGLVSLFADVAYEGARSITGPYMAILGASGFAVSFVAGLGELLAYGLRIFSGFISDKTRNYWGIATVGYLINLISVPLMGFASEWRTVALLTFTQRVGKATRAPARDTIISYAAKNVGTGFGYGLHEAFDMVGALAGPILISIFFYFHFGYETSFMLLFVPGLVAMSVLAVARKKYPRPEVFEREDAEKGEGGAGKGLWTLILAVSFLGMGYADFPLIAYHAKKRAILSDANIPLLYSLAMAACGASALLFGRLFDKIGTWAVILGAACAASFSWFAFMGGPSGMLVGVLLWGVGTGVQESVMKAAIANLIRSSARGRVFGFFNASFGIFSFFGNAIIGLLYDKSVLYLVYFSIGAHLLAFAFLATVSKRMFKKPRPKVTDDG
ncbi:MAG: MFS transporter [Nitrospinae bacterium]|nr:MFS transporter [Nitrospinota bacterium]